MVAKNRDLESPFTANGPHTASQIEVSDNHLNLENEIGMKLLTLRIFKK